MQTATLNHARIVMDGNSITAGNNYGDPNDTIGKQLLYQLKSEGILGLSLAEFAVGGQTCAQMINGGSQTIGASFDSQRNNFLIVNEGGNDITFGATPGQAFDNFRNYCLLRKSEGYYVLVWDCLFRNNSASGFYTAAGYRQALVDFNNLVKNSWKEFAHGYMDARKEFPYAPLNDYTGALNGGFWFPDCVHPSATANGVIASKLIQHLKRIPSKIIKV